MTEHVGNKKSEDLFWSRYSAIESRKLTSKRMRKFAASADERREEGYIPKWSLTEKFWLFDESDTIAEMWVQNVWKNVTYYLLITSCFLGACFLLVVCGSTLSTSEAEILSFLIKTTLKYLTLAAVLMAAFSPRNRFTVLLASLLVEKDCSILRSYNRVLEFVFAWKCIDVSMRLLDHILRTDCPYDELVEGEGGEQLAYLVLVNYFTITTENIFIWTIPMQPALASAWLSVTMIGVYLSLHNCLYSTVLKNTTFMSVLDRYEDVQLFVFSVVISFILTRIRFVHQRSLYRNKKYLVAVAQQRQNLVSILTFEIKLALEYMFRGVEMLKGASGDLPLHLKESTECMRREMISINSLSDDVHVLAKMSEDRYNVRYETKMSIQNLIQRLRRSFENDSWLRVVRIVDTTDEALFYCDQVCLVMIFKYLLLLIFALVESKGRLDNERSSVDHSVQIPTASGNLETGAANRACETSHYGVELHCKLERSTEQAGSSLSAKQFNTNAKCNLVFTLVDTNPFPHCPANSGASLSTLNDYATAVLDLCCELVVRHGGEMAVRSDNELEATVCCFRAVLTDRGSRSTAAPAATNNTTTSDSESAKLLEPFNRQNKICLAPSEFDVVVREISVARSFIVINNPILKAATIDVLKSGIGKIPDTMTVLDESEIGYYKNGIKKADFIFVSKAETWVEIQYILLAYSSNAIGVLVSSQAEYIDDNAMTMFHSILSFPCVDIQGFLMDLARLVRKKSAKVSAPFVNNGRNIESGFDGEGESGRSSVSGDDWHSQISRISANLAVVRRNIGVIFARVSDLVVTALPPNTESNYYNWLFVNPTNSFYHHSVSYYIRIGLLFTYGVLHSRPDQLGLLFLIGCCSSLSCVANRTKSRLRPILEWFGFTPTRLMKCLAIFMLLAIIVSTVRIFYYRVDQSWRVPSNINDPKDVANSQFGEFEGKYLILNHFMSGGFMLSLWIVYFPLVIAYAFMVVVTARHLIVWHFVLCPLIPAQHSHIKYILLILDLAAMVGVYWLTFSSEQTSRQIYLHLRSFLSKKSLLENCMTVCFHDARGPIERVLRIRRSMLNAIGDQVLVNPHFVKIDMKTVSLFRTPPHFLISFLSQVGYVNRMREKGTLSDDNANKMAISPRAVVPLADNISSSSTSSASGQAYRLSHQQSQQQWQQQEDRQEEKERAAEIPDIGVSFSLSQAERIRLCHPMLLRREIQSCINHFMNTAVASTCRVYLNIENLTSLVRTNKQLLSDVVHHALSVCDERFKMHQRDTYSDDVARSVDDRAYTTYTRPYNYSDSPVNENRRQNAELKYESLATNMKGNRGGGGGSGSGSGSSGGDSNFGYEILITVLPMKKPVDRAPYHFIDFRFFDIVVLDNGPVPAGQHDVYSHTQRCQGAKEYAKALRNVFHYHCPNVVSSSSSSAAAAAAPITHKSVGTGTGGTSTGTCARSENNDQQRAPLISTTEQILLEKLLRIDKGAKICSGRLPPGPYNHSQRFSVPCLVDKLSSPASFAVQKHMMGDLLVDTSLKRERGVYQRVLDAATLAKASSEGEAVGVERDAPRENDYCRRAGDVGIAFKADSLRVSTDAQHREAQRLYNAHINSISGATRDIYGKITHQRSVVLLHSDHPDNALEYGRLCSYLQKMEWHCNCIAIGTSTAANSSSKVNNLLKHRDGKNKTLSKSSRSNTLSLAVEKLDRYAQEGAVGAATGAMTGTTAAVSPHAYSAKVAAASAAASADHSHEKDFVSAYDYASMKKYDCIIIDQDIEVRSDTRISDLLLHIHVNDCSSSIISVVCREPMSEEQKLSLNQHIFGPCYEIVKPISDQTLINMKTRYDQLMIQRLLQ